MSVGSPFIKIPIFTTCLCAAILTGCSVIRGKVTETYASKYETTVQVSKDILDKLEIDILRVISDRLTTTIIARRTSGELVTIEVIRIDHRQTKVSVRSDDGIFKRKTAKMILDLINSNLEFTNTNLSKSLPAIQTFKEISYT